MNLGDIETLVGHLTNDPVHDRYTTANIDEELDFSQNEWNAEAGILKDTVTLTVVDGTRTYALSTLTGTPIRFSRVTHKGVELEKKDKSWFDMYTSNDWATDTGTPKFYYIEGKDPDDQQVVIYPIPQAVDAGANLVVEYIKMHTTLASSTDTPWNANTLTAPYHYGLGYHVSYRLLLRDPSNENLQKAGEYKKVAEGVKANIVQVFTALEKAEPFRIRGGRRWGGAGSTSKL